jgi:hypothetical protein
MRRGIIGAMKHRKLRIAWSVAWGIVAVLLIALWVRSYQWVDVMAVRSGRAVVSTQGKILTGVVNASEWPRLIESSKQNISLPPLRYTLLGFGYEQAPVLPAICIPDSGIVCLVAALSVTPWLHLRFSLRTLLIATTLVAVALGLIVWLTR